MKLSKEAVIRLFLVIIILGAVFVSGQVIVDTYRNHQLVATESSEVKPINLVSPSHSASIPFWDQKSAFASFKDNYEHFDYVSLFWYGLRPDGSIRKYIYAVEDKKIIKFAKSNDIKVFALVANLPDEDDGGDWDYKRVDKVISSAASRKKHIADLVALTKRFGVDGINIDYEALKGYQKKNFSIFIKELGESLHANEKLLAVALHPKNREGDLSYSNGSQAQDWRELAKYADQLRLMTYDEHWNSSKPGPIASVPWLRSILNYAKTLIPQEKLFVGVPLYGYDWGEGQKANGLTYQDVQKLIKVHKPKVLWDSKSEIHYFKYIASGTTHTVWYEDSASFGAKLDLFDSLGTTNLSFWRLGGEDQRIWQTLQNHQ